MGIYYLNNSKSELSKKYFSKAKKIKSRTILDYFVIESLYVWSNLNNNFDDSIVNLSKIDNRFENLKKIQKVFLNCYFNTNEVQTSFEELVLNQKTDFSRYNFFMQNI